jgi:Ca2+-binding EF-hand superfamily protein
MDLSQVASMSPRRRSSAAAGAVNMFASGAFFSTVIDEEDQKLMGVFTMFDFDDGGQIHASDLPYVLKGLGLGPDVLSYSDIQAMQKAMDPTDTGLIPYDVFKRVIKHSHAETMSHEEQWKAFRLFDPEKKGYVSEQDLISIAVEDCQGILTEEQCKFIAEHLTGIAGRHKSHRVPGITFDDWKKAISKTSLLRVNQK